MRHLQCPLSSQPNSSGFFNQPQGRGVKSACSRPHLNTKRVPILKLHKPKSFHRNMTCWHPRDIDYQICNECGMLRQARLFAKCLACKRTKERLELSVQSHVLHTEGLFSDISRFCNSFFLLTPRLKNKNQLIKKEPVWCTS